MKMKTQQPKPVEHYKSSVKGKVHSNTSLPQETRKSQIDNVKQVAKEDIKNPRVSRGKKS